MLHDDIHKSTVGRWRSILIHAGINAEFLTRKHTACPMCGGKDRFRWDDRDGRGTFYCSQCGAGNGIDLVMRFKGCAFIEAKRLVLDALGESVVEAPKARSQMTADKVMATWRAALPLTGDDPASLYLMARSISLEHSPKSIRYLPKARYWHGDKHTSEHPAMLALYAAPDNRDWTWHMTYLDAAGNKAVLPEAKKTAPRSIPKGGAVRLAASAETMGIAEGIETALSAAELFGIPVWSGLNGNGLMHWQPPAGVKYALVFGDNDKTHDGQAKAHNAVYLLKKLGIIAEPRIPEEEGWDWNDVLKSEKGGKKIETLGCGVAV